MIAYIITTSLGVLISKKVRNWKIIILLCFLVGICTSIFTNSILGMTGFIDSKTAIQSIAIGGLLVYPMITFVSLLLTRLSSMIVEKIFKGNRKSNENIPTTIIKDSSRTTKNKFIQTSNYRGPSVTNEIMEIDKRIMEEKGDERFWEIADQEISSEPKHDLWIKCLYATNHEENKAKTLYVHERVIQLKTEEYELKKENNLKIRKVRRERSKKLFKFGFFSVFFIASFLSCTIFIITILFAKRGEYHPFRYKKHVKEIENIIKEKKWTEAFVEVKSYGTYYTINCTYNDYITLAAKKDLKPTEQEWLDKCNQFLKEKNEHMYIQITFLFLSIVGSVLSVIFFLKCISKFRESKKIKKV